MVPISRQVPTVIRPSQIGTDVTYEPPLRVGFGINDQTVEGARATMGRTGRRPRRWAPARSRVQFRGL